MLLVWVGVALVLAIALIYELGKWRSLATEGARVAAERERLTRAIRATEAEIVKEMRASAGLLQEMQWTSAGGDPAAFLTRLADLVQEKRMRVNSIGTLERSTTAQFSKTWHTVSVVAPYREVRELATRVESEKGILEDMVLEPVPFAPNRPSDEVQARFKMTALELTPEAQKVFDRSLAAAGPGPASQAPGGPQLALAVPSKPPEVPVTVRDPFAFGATKPVATATARARTASAGTGKAGPPRPGTPKPPKPEVVFELRGIVGFPGGQLAIINNQIVKGGDTVSGWRVERITDTNVVLRDPTDGETRTVPLPDLLGAAQAGPRR